MATYFQGSRTMRRMAQWSLAYCRMARTDNSAWTVSTENRPFRGRDWLHLFLRGELRRRQSRKSHSHSKRMITHSSSSTHTDRTRSGQNGWPEIHLGHISGRIHAHVSTRPLQRNSACACRLSRDHQSFCPTPLLQPHHHYLRRTP